VRILDARIDSLYWSASASLGGWYTDAVAAQQASVSARTPLPWRVANGHALLLRPHGMGRYRVVADAAEFQIRLTDSEHVPHRVRAVAIPLH